MNQAFEVLPFGGGEMEGEMERSAMRMPRGGGRGGGVRPFAAGGAPRGRPGARTQAKGPAPMGHMPFRARHGRRAYFGPPWPYYYGPYYGPGWPYPSPSTANVFDDGGSDADAGPGDAGPQGEMGMGGGCNCPRCRQRATAFEVLPFGG